MVIESNRMNILILDDTLEVGGKERLLLSALHGISRENYTVHLCILKGEGSLLQKAIQVADYYIITRRRLSLSLSTCIQIRKYIKKNSIDIVHCNGVVDAFHVWLATKGLRVKKICTIHGYEARWHIAIHKYILRQFDGIVAVSKSFLIDLIKLGYRSKSFFIVPNCFNNEFQGIINECASNPIRIVCVSRFDWSKDQITIVNACKLLIDQGLDIKIDLIGSGHKQYIEPVKDRVIDYGLEDRVRFLGTIQNVAEILRDYDLFVMSSYAESFGISIIEAMSTGLPIIASDIPPFREITANGKYGMHFGCGNITELADKIKSLYDNRSEIKKYSILSLERALQYTEERCCRRLELVYSHLLACSGTHEITSTNGIPAISDIIKQTLDMSHIT